MLDTNFVLREDRVVKNVTVTLDESVARWVRVKAAEEGKSVSRYLGELLEKQMLEHDAYEEAMRHYFSIEPVNLGDGKPYPSRDELHDRAGLR
jgi:hypothetical protein